MNERQIIHTIERLLQVRQLKWLFFVILSIIWVTCQNNGNGFEGPLTDPRDGQVYQTVAIGSQIWMAENLNYRPDSGSWYYNDDSVSNAAIYGRLYNWSTAMTVAPPGWHLPTDAEWNTLTDFIGSDTTMIAAQLLDTTHWDVRVDATNETGFSARPGGDRYWQTGVFYSIGASAYFWTATTGDSTHQAYDRDLDTWNGVGDDPYTHVHRHSYNKIDGFSIRCVKD